MTRAVIYSRQSLGRTGETSADSLSLDSQEQACREHADRAGWDVVGAVRDHDLKGYDPTRPALAEALDAVESGRADVLIVHALDRLAADLVWLRGQEAEIATSRAALDRDLAALPRVRDRADVAATVALLVGVRDDLADATDDVLGPVLDQLGEVVVEDGCARLRYLPDVAVCLPMPTAVPIPRLQRRNAT